ncbi:MAG: hemerythrin domain-containing protein [Phycisphaerae bacterium]
MATMNPEEKPSTVLKNEHQVILRVLRVLETLVIRVERGDGFEVAPLKQCVTFFRLFADACHHAKEETLLFPVLEQRGIPKEGGPIGVMLYEHSQAREFTRRMGEALEAFESGDAGAETQFRSAARSYMDLLINHIHKEDNVLFNMGDQVMTDEDQSSLCGQFCEVGCRAFDGKKRDELKQMADDLEQAWGG